MATRSDREMAVLVWNYHDDELSGGRRRRCAWRLTGIPSRAARVLVQHYRIDDDAQQRLYRLEADGLAAAAHARAVRATGSRGAAAVAGVA